ncbi:hypothetical protein L0664_07025 [Octadecabacter sp. G9-8]|uniref:MarR family transcriptional regulator n=1 Tax=Octadecabacter dasysiphoniae TaxID=2909341 RepID=A0ABS9CU91_9RHOB|nr:hypothetical protein [Octadecabacter dasysiphoniae]MCF2870814.1 hypothetical protein [Octadecabacter dasysiphoniae]
MDNKILQQIATLRSLLEEMEHEFGMRDLSRNERDILLAMAQEQKARGDSSDMCSTEAVRENSITKELSQPTFHRTLKQLVKRGLVEPCEGFPKGLYRLTNSADGYL